MKRDNYHENKNRSKQSEHSGDRLTWFHRSLDNLNHYYDPKLKEYRLSLINLAAEKSLANHTFVKGSIADKELLNKLFDTYHFKIVVNLAAQAGVRYSIDHPDVYVIAS